MRFSLSFFVVAAVAALLSSVPGSSVSGVPSIAKVAVKNTPNKNNNTRRKRFLSSDVSFTPSKEVLPKETPPSTKSAVSSFVKNESLQKVVTITAATALTYMLNNVYDMGPILASSITTFLSAMILSENFALAATCGSFAGMAKATVIPDFTSSIVLGITCTLMMTVFDHFSLLLGVGGRLGFIAQCACTFQFIVSSLLPMAIPKPANAAALLGSAYPNTDTIIKSLPAVALYTASGAFFMSFWKQIMAKQNKKYSSEFVTNIYQRLSTSCAAVGGTGLVACLALSPSVSSAVAGPAFCGSFIAMSSPAKLPTYGALLGASIMGAIVQQCMATTVLLGGWGGKLGTAALFGVFAYNIFGSAVNGFSRMSKEKHE